MKNQQIDKEICDLEKELRSLQSQLTELHQQRLPEEVKEYEFTGPNGKTTLKDLFGDKDELIVIHNMGQSCPYCTLWADGFNGFTEHLLDRAAFALTTADDFKAFSTFATQRGWRFPIYSTEGNTDFQKDMGFYGPAWQGKGESPWPGMSFLLKEGDKVFRKTRVGLGPGDLYCSLWHIFDRLPKGINGWQPKYRYN